MPITQGNLTFKRSLVSDDTTANGGRITQSDIGSNLFPDVSGQQRQDGASQWRKAFLKNENTDGSGWPNLTLYDSKAFIQQISPADDAVMVKPGTPTDTFANYSADTNWKTTGWHGVGYLYPNPTNESSPVDYAGVGETVCRVICDTPYVAGNLFFPGVALFDNGAGTSQFVTVSSVAGPLAGTDNVCTLTFTSTPLTYQFDNYSFSYTSDAGTYTTATTIGNSSCNFGVVDSLQHKLVMLTSGPYSGMKRRILSNTQYQLTVDYAWPGIPTATTFVVLKTMVSMCCPLGNILATRGTVTYPTGNGQVFFATNLKIFPVGAIDETWTIRCVDAGPTKVWVEGAAVGNVPGPNGDLSFNIATGVKPANAFGSSYYFDLPSSCWGGNFLQNDTVSFATVSSSKALWVKRLVPVNANAHLNNSWELAASGDTV